MFELAHLKTIDLPNIHQLRNMAYSYKNTQTNLLLLENNQKDIDRISVHFGYKHKDNLIASFRGTLIHDIELLEKMIQCKLPQLKFVVKLPIICTSLEVTHPDFRHLGLQVKLRKELISYFINKNFSRFISTSISNDKWNKALKDLGYQIFSHPSKWTDFFKMEQNIQINYLEKINSPNKLSLL